MGCGWHGAGVRREGGAVMSTVREMLDADAVSADHAPSESEMLDETLYQTWRTLETINKMNLPLRGVNASWPRRLMAQIDALQMKVEQ